jgi:hypothetical protein
LVFGPLRVKGTEFVQATADDAAVFQAHVHRSCEGGEGGREGGREGEWGNGPEDDGAPTRVIDMQ